MKKKKKQQLHDHDHDHPSSSCSSPKPNNNCSSSSTTTTNSCLTQHSNSAVLLSSASHLTRAELVKRRLEKLSLLSKCYRDLYWALMDLLKAHFRHFGLSPFRFTHSPSPSPSPSFLHQLEGSGENTTNPDGRCPFLGCKLKPIPFSTFCHFHILSDSSQTLYKPCSYVIKSAQAGPITCGKPILRSTVPSLCTVHFEKAQKHLSRTFKRTALNVSSTNKTPPKFHVIVTEYVRQIQVKRRTELRGKQKVKLWFGKKMIVEHHGSGCKHNL